jgi:probable HAF family extracellular repeat protein
MKTSYRSIWQSVIPGLALFAGLLFATHIAAQDRRPYLIDLHNKTVTELGTLGGIYNNAWALNDAGQVVGSSSTPSGAWHAFVTGADGVGMRDLTAF